MTSAQAAEACAVKKDQGWSARARPFGRVARPTRTSREGLMRAIFALAVGMAAAILNCATPSQADPVAEFYRGKTLRIMIGYGPGGGYDLYGRLFAEFLPRYLPGNPVIVPQNMPGGGSFVAAKYLYDVAPRDGTVFGSLAQTLALDSVSKKGQIDVTKFSYLGRLVTNVDTGVATLKSGIKSFDDVRSKEFIVGASGSGSTTVLFPTALKTYAGAKFKLVKGYHGTTDITLAMERGEVDIVGAYGLPGMMTTKPGWPKGDGATIIYQASLKRHRLIPNVPTLPELGLTEEGRKVLRAASSTGEIGRSILTTPGVPPERLAALRKAFAAMLADPDFLAAAEKRNMMIDPGTGEEMDTIVRETLELPEGVLQEVGKLMQ
jgi:tripartite-type tricarboxylate transporter receptor subunit TctC